MAPKTPTVSVTEFAADHGLTSRRVQQWIAEGMPYRDEGGNRRIVRAEANRWIREKERDEATKAATPDSTDDAERRKATADAQLAELRLARETGQVVPIDEATKAVEDMLGQLRAQLLTLPARWAPRMVGLKTLQEATLTIEGAVHEAMTALATDPLK
ncbi:MAG: terminase small subunit [Gemmatimonadales bacterium]|nr:terminase small subunit [Gemmatimonadales bacterium]